MHELNELPLPPVFDSKVWEEDSVMKCRPAYPCELPFGQVRQVLKPGYKDSLLFVDVIIMTKDMVSGQEEGNQPLSCVIYLDEAGSPEFDLRLWADLAVLTNRNSGCSYYLPTFATFLSHFGALIHNNL